MELYFSPLACSMATRIALYEAGSTATYLEVDPKTKTVLKDGSDFRTINPLGLVPTLRTDDGVVLTENAAILQYVAERQPPAWSAAGCSNGSASSAPSCTRACSCRSWTARRDAK
jgi:glutathione S-transferase